MELGNSTSNLSGDVREPDSSTVLQGNSAEPRVGSSRVQRIREAAYRKAQQRGFTPGAELDDWLAAEREIDEGG